MENIKHIVVAISEKCQTILVVSITSQSFDGSCRIEAEEIVDNSNKQVLNHTSYVGYKFAYEFEGFETFENFRKIYRYRCNISDELLKRICDGAKRSPFLIKKYKKYFDL